MSGLKLKTIPQFPSQVIGGAGIDVEKQNGNWTVALDYTEFAVVSPYTPQPNHYVLIFDATSESYFLVPATSFG
jgi:hypothetical protein